MGLWKVAGLKGNRPDIFRERSLPTSRRLQSTMPSDAVNAATRRGWRELRVFMTAMINLAAGWIVDGLQRFKGALLSSVSDAHNVIDSEHEHSGSYMYLGVMTWPEACFDHHAVRGPLPDLAHSQN